MAEQGRLHRYSGRFVLILIDIESNQSLHKIHDVKTDNEETLVRKKKRRLIMCEMN